MGESASNGQLGNAHTRKPANSHYSQTHSNGTALRTSQPQGQPWNGPIQIGERVAGQMIQVSYNAQHKVPWHWPVPAYLVTKGIGSGIFMLLALGWGLKLFPFDGLTALVGGFLSLLFIGLTTGFLVLDLEKPERFLYILLRPQWRSWLARGAVILIGLSTITGLWWLYELGAYLFDYDVPLLRAVFLWVGLPFAIMAAIYTAFLFAQAEGRDLWQSPLLPFHLIVQALVAGMRRILAPFGPGGADGRAHRAARTGLDHGPAREFPAATDWRTLPRRRRAAWPAFPRSIAAGGA